MRHNAQKKLNSAAKAAQGITSPLLTMEEPSPTPSRQLQYSDDYDDDESDEDREEYDNKEYESVEATDDTDEGDEQEEEDDGMGGFDMGDEALGQVRYRLENAKIIPFTTLRF